MKTLEVKITQQFLDNNDKYIESHERHLSCPVTHAIQAMGFKEVRTFRRYISFMKCNKIYLSKNSSKLQRFLRELDQRKNKKPTSFIIEII